MPSAAPVTATFSYKTLWADVAWTEDANVDVLKVAFSCAPKIGAARFRLKYGYIYEAGATGTGSSVVTPTNYRGKWIRIYLTDGVTPLYWYGYCPEEAATFAKTGIPGPLAQAGTEVQTGDSDFIAYTMDYFLKEHIVGRSYVETAVAGTAEAVLRALPFNRGRRGRDSELTGNRSSTLIDGSSAYSHSRTETNSWTARQAVNALLYSFWKEFDITYLLGGQESWLDQITEPWGNVEGRSYYHVLTDLIKQSRGYTFYFDGFTIQVVSITDTPIGSVIPANANVVALSLDTSTIAQPPRVNHLDNVHYDKIIVEGEPLRVGFSMKSGDENFEAGWTGGEQTAYESLADDARRDAAQRHVYCRYHIPVAWDGEIGGVVNIPQITPATGAADWATAQKMYLPGIALDRTIPIYTVDSKTLSPPRVWFLADDGEYYRIEDPDNDNYRGSSVRVVDDRPGLIVRPRIPHYLGKDVFAGSPEASGTAAAIDYREIVATVSMFTDDRVRVEVTATDAEPGEVTKVKRLVVPNAHLWVLAPGTRKSWKASAWEEVAAGGEIVRDDTAILQKVAEMAQVWYGRRRAEIAVEYSELWLLNRLGHVIAEATAAGTTIPAGTVVTDIHYDMSALTVGFSTEWKDIELGALLSPRDGMTTAVGRRLSRVEDQLANTPVLTSGGGAGGGKSTDVIITGVHPDSPVGANVRVYRGTEHDNGPAKAATATDVTIIAGNIAGGQVIPNATEARARLIAGYSWTNDVAATVTEDIYQIESPTCL